MRKCPLGLLQQKTINPFIKHYPNPENTEQPYKVFKTSLKFDCSVSSEISIAECHQHSCEYLFLLLQKV